MPDPHAALRCPFCQSPLPARAAACGACHARKGVRAGMSPRGFTAFVILWLACAGAIMGAAGYLAVLPWTPGREAPPYALRLLGHQSSASPARCRVELVEPGAPRATVTLVPCGAQATAPVQAQGLDASTRRLAAALHGVLVLGAGMLLSWGLLRGLRLLFIGRRRASWVRRAAA